MGSGAPGGVGMPERRRVPARWGFSRSSRAPQERPWLRLRVPRIGGRRCLENGGCGPVELLAWFPRPWERQALRA
ncbi:hypothetical protein SBD_7720 [Streptomyces bottropensis ATCC 25435]|uniref:Uncharacterized protein n=1 Tax=Streptomyces bottropensis ATCC 25435 TaxID=1054862 RepID=M3FG65_9ACTN|nr:hypothetical protein SBD_7720 [Streptomyces bottropensis ATCC 25435]